MSINPGPLEPANDLPPLEVKGVTRPAQDPSDLILTFNRRPTDGEMRAIHSLPPSPVIAAEAQASAEHRMLAELAVRLFRVLILGNIVIVESPAAMDWLRDWIDGTFRGLGPLGKGPMIWPERLPTVCGLLRSWGFQPTPTMPPFVMLIPGEEGMARPSTDDTLKALVGDATKLTGQAGAATEVGLAVSYLRHLATLRPADANGLGVAASDIEAGFHLDPSLNPAAGGTS